MINSDNLSLNKKNIDTILVLDFGSQYTQLIARRIRELNVFSEILPWDIPVEKIKLLNPKGIILSGGPESVTVSNTPRIPEVIFELHGILMVFCIFYFCILYYLFNKKIENKLFLFLHTIGILLLIYGTHQGVILCGLHF